MINVLGQHSLTSCVAEENHIPWPVIEGAYTDMFGQIEVEVFRAAGELWPQAERYSRQALRDGQSGQMLLLQAAAIVSRIYVERVGQISDLKAYLYQTFKRLVLARLELERGHRRLESEMLHRTADEPDPSTTNLEQKILLQQIVKRMDNWMREIFELLILGHTFEEIARNSNQDAHRLRSKYNKLQKKLIKQIQAEMPATEQKNRQGGR
jgi:DNA-directed RNA polymerase specialized sigma24 family protein